jgi:hypothetical protein
VVLDGANVRELRKSIEEEMHLVFMVVGFILHLPPKSGGSFYILRTSLPLNSGLSTSSSSRNAANNESPMMIESPRLQTKVMA